MGMGVRTRTPLCIYIRTPFSRDNRGRRILHKEPPCVYTVESPSEEIIRAWVYVLESPSEGVTLTHRNPPACCFCPKQQALICLRGMPVAREAWGEGERGVGRGRGVVRGRGGDEKVV